MADEYVVIIDLTFYSRIQACVMVNQRAMKLIEGTVYKVKFYVFLPENLEASWPCKKLNVQDMN